MTTLTANEQITESLTENEVADYRSGSITDMTSLIDPPQVWVEFLNRDEEFEVEDIQVEGNGWDLIELRSDGYSDGILGPVSYVQTVHHSMVEHIEANPGVYALVSVEGVMPEWVFAGNDRQIGWALAKRG